MGGGTDPSPRRPLERARADVEAGALWKARDRLHGLVRLWPADQQVLGMLGDVLFAMGDLPAAARCWYLTEGAGGRVDEAMALTRDRQGEGETLSLRHPVAPEFELAEGEGFEPPRA